MGNATQVQFKAGRLVLVDASGFAVPVAELVDCTVSLDAEDKQLPSDEQVAKVSVRMSRKVGIKAKVQRVFGLKLHQAMFGGTLTPAAANVVIDRESHPAAATVVAGATTTFLLDLGVFDGETGLPMDPIASAPAVGQYVPGAAGVGSYSFNAGETGTVQLCYRKSSTTGEKLVVSNGAQVESPNLVGYFWNNTKQEDGTTLKQNHWQFYRLVPGKATEAQKRGDFAESDLELSALSKADNTFYEINQSPGA